MPDPAVPDVPTFDALYRQIKGTNPSGPLWDAWFMPLISYARYTIFFPPGVPQAAIDAMTTGLELVCADPQYQADIRRIELDPKCYLREEARAITAASSRAPPGGGECAEDSVVAELTIATVGTYFSSLRSRSMVEGTAA